MNKLVSSIREAVELSGLRDGMTVSFHHHLRNGDYVLNMVMEQIAALGIRDLTVNASSLFDVHQPLADHIRNHVVTALQTDYMSAGLGREISRGLMEKPVEFRTHGGRPSDIAGGRTPIDVAFIAAPSADPMGNCTGKFGKSACGSLGYAIPDAMYAKKVVVITDNLVSYPLEGWSIPEIYVDYVVSVDAIGDPEGIVSGTTRITRDPVGLVMASYAAKVIERSGLLKDGFSFQTGGGGPSLAVTRFLRPYMEERGIKMSFAMGGITRPMVELLKEGFIRTIVDAQDFDIASVESVNTTPGHYEISTSQYANPMNKGAFVNRLDFVILGALEIDVDYNVNVITGSNGVIRGAPGGHVDTAAGSKCSIMVAPLVRSRISTVKDRVITVTTPGESVDVLVTDYGVSINPRRQDLLEALKDSGLPLCTIEELRDKAYALVGKPEEVQFEEQVVALVEYRDGTIIDVVRKIGSL